MTYQTEFPDYDPATLPDIPAGWTDTSWHNNTAPSFQTPDDRFSVWIDYLDPQLRECQGGPRFLVHELAPEGHFTTDEALLETDDWSEVLQFVKRA